MGMLGELMTEVASADIAYYVMDALHLWLDGCFSARNKDPIDSHAWLHMTGLGLQWHRPTTAASEQQQNNENSTRYQNTMDNSLQYETRGLKEHIMKSVS